nr:lipocalin Cav p 2.0101-like isoform X1 [Manis javanica]
MLSNTGHSPSCCRRTAGTMKMRALLLTLLLGLVSANHEPASEDDYPSVSRIQSSGWKSSYCIPGDWYSVLKAANDTKKITENGELRFYIRRLRCSEGCDKINIDFYTKVNGICQTHSIESTKRENDTYEVDFKGKISFKFTVTSRGVLLIYAEHTDADGKKTVVTELLAKVPQIKKREYDNFKNFSQKKGITGEKIEDVTITDTCPLIVH